MSIASAFFRALVPPVVLLAARVAFHEPMSGVVWLSLAVMALATFGIFVRGRNISAVSRYTQALLVCIAVAFCFTADSGNRLTVADLLWGLALGMLIIGGDDLMDRVWP